MAARTVTRPDAREPDRPPLPAGRRRLVQTLLIAVMAVGSIAMWLVIPVLWLWVASQLQTSTNPTLGPYLLVLFGIPLSMVLVGKLLGAADRFYARVRGDARHVKAQLPWQKSMRGERGSTRRRTVLDVVMVVSVGLALLCLGLWFFLLAGSSLPT